MSLTTEHTMRILLLSDLILYLSKIDPADLAGNHPLDIVNGFFLDRQRSAMKEVVEGEDTLKGLKVVK